MPRKVPPLHCLCKHSLFASPIAKAEVRHREAIHGVSKKTMVKGSKINRCAFVSLSLEEKGSYEPLDSGLELISEGE